MQTAKIDEIAHELEELGQEIKPHILHQKHGFNEFKESLVHKLRHAVYEKDKLFHAALKELEEREAQQTSVDALLVTLQNLQEELKAPRMYEIAWKSAEVDLKKEHDLRQKQEKEKVTIQELLHTLQRIEQELIKARNHALTTGKLTEMQLQEELEKNNSISSLLWRAIKLSGRRIRNVVGFILPFGRHRKTTTE